MRLEPGIGPFLISSRASGFASAFAVWLFNRWLEKHPEPTAEAAQA